MLPYIVLKNIVRLALRLFFSRFQVYNLSQLQALRGPLIIASNHPNTFMDPLILAVLTKQRVGFIANGSIFNHYTRHIFNYFHVIPIYRKKDTADVALSQAELNKQTFQRCYDYLENGGTIMIFPEGTSEIERRLREIKTGTARIALGAEYENNFTLGVKILPIGINYSNPTQYRGEVFVNIGSPIKLADFRENYTPEHFEVVEQLTNILEQKLRELVIITDDNEDDNFVAHIEVLYKNKLFDELGLDEESERDEFVIVKQIIEAVHYFEQHEPQLVSKLQIKTENYLENLQKIGINDEVFSQSRRLYAQFINTYLKLIIGLPLYLFGLLTHYIPYKLPYHIARSITKDITYHAPIMMTAAVIIFPIFYGLNLWIVQYLFQNVWVTVVFAVLLPISGFFVLWYWDKFLRFTKGWRAIRLFQKKPSLMKSLWEERKNLFELFDKSLHKYLQQLNRIEQL